MTLKKRIFNIFYTSDMDDPLEKYVNGLITGLILLSVVAVILETEESLYTQYRAFFDDFEIITVIIFTVEYVLRLWVCTMDPRYSSPVWGRLRYALSPLALIDLISILPFYLPVSGFDFRFIRAVRLTRLFRIFKLSHYSQSLMALGRVLRSKKEELLVTVFSGLILLVISASLMYYVEREAQPEAFKSILSAMWWGVATLTTIGYGDIYPVTTLGKFLGSLIAVMGIGLFALPAGIVASGFASELQNKARLPHICPHCGKDIDAPHVQED